MASVFLSYDHGDVAQAARIATALENAGHSVWWDRHIHGGAEFQSEIEKAVEEADAVVVLWSSRSIKSPWVRDEAAEGRDEGKLIPVLLEPVKPPMGFRQFQTIDLSDRRRASGPAQVESLLHAVAKMTAAPSSPQATPATVRNQGIGRRTLIAGGAAATAAVAGIGAWAFLKPEATDATDTIAVLPFANLSGDPKQAYFADGMAGEIRSTLMRIGSLKVAGSTSSAAVREDDAQTAAKKLGVANILTGNVRQTPSTVRVTAELVDGRTGLAKWSQNYDRAPGDVIRIQTDIAENVARALAVALGASAIRAIGAGETANVAAQQLAFQARELSYQFTKPAFYRSVELIDKAIAIDPNYARAFALKSFFITNLAGFPASSADVAKGRREAVQYARKALSIAPDLPIARSALAYAYQLSLRLREAMDEHRIAFSLAGGDPDVIRNYGWSRSSILGETSEGLRLVDEARALDPFNSASHSARADVLFDARRYADVISYSIQVRRESPELFKFAHLLGHSFLMLGQIREAAVAFEGDIVGQALLAARSGNRDLALTKLAEMRSRNGDIASFDYSRVLAQLRDTDAAFDALDRSWDIRDKQLTGLKTDPYLDPLRTAPRYAALLRKMDFPV
ncbi:MAG: TIR domain-containing protein [Pseudomonadota bacterium]